MTSPFDSTPQSLEEAVRLARLQRQLDEVTAKLRAEGIEVEATAGFEPPDQAMVDDIARNDAAIFVRAQAYTFEQVKGTTLPVLPVAEIDGLDWLRRAVIGGRVTCNYFGIATELAGAPMPLSVVFRLVTMGQETPLYIDVDAAPQDWKDAALKRVVVAWPKIADGRRPFIATGPMKRFPRPIVVDPVKVGRNDPCPCGSGEKSKRCCFR